MAALRESVEAAKSKQQREANPVDEGRLSVTEFTAPRPCSAVGGGLHRRARLVETLGSERA